MDVLRELLKSDPKLLDEMLKNFEPIIEPEQKIQLAWSPTDAHENEALLPHADTLQEMSSISN